MNYREEIAFYLRVLKRRFAHLIVPMVLVGTAGSVIVMSLPSIYSSSGKILVESQQIPNVLVQSTVTALASERVQVLQQRVMTRENVLALADKFSLFANRRNLSKTDLVSLIQSRITFEMIDLEATVKKKARKDQVAIAFSVGFDHEQPGIASKVANELVTIILEDDARNRTKRASDTTEFLKQENERLAQELESAEAQISEFKLKNSIALPEKLAFNMGILERQQQEIQTIDREIRAAEDGKRLLVLEASIRKAQPNAAADGGKAPNIDQQLQALKDQYTERLTLLSENHPQMRAFRKLIATKEAMAATAKASVVEAAPIDLKDPNLSVETRILAEKIAAVDSGNAALQARKAQLISSNNTLQDIIVQTPKIAADLSSMERHRASLQNSSDQMAAKLAQAQLGERLEENQQAERFEVLEAPVVAQEPSRPKRSPLMFIVAGLSVFAGAASAFGADLLSGTIKRSSDLSRRLNLKVLTVIPYIETRREYRRSRIVSILVVLALLAALGFGLLAIHLFYSPLDILALRATAYLKSLVNS